MMESNHNFDDFELDDDTEDLWYDDTVEESYLDETFDVDFKEDFVPPLQKKKYIIKPLIAIVAVGGLIYLSISFIQHKDIKEQPPIVKLVKIQNNITKQNHDTNNVSQINTKELDKIKGSRQENVLDKNIAKIIAVEKNYDSVLTPMPDSFIDNIKQNITEKTAHPLLIEDELLSKTDTAFDPIEQKLVIAEAPLTVKELIDSNIEPENNHIKDQEVIIELPTIVKDVITPKKAEKIKIVKKHIAPPKKKPIWIIRAAQSRNAVIYDKNSKEMKSIEIGDTVNGVGRIKAIKKIDGAWIIIGTLGKIRQ